MYHHGPLSILEVDTRSKPLEVIKYATALASGFGKVREVEAAAAELTLEQNGELEEYGGEIDAHGRWSRKLGPWGCTVKIYENRPGGMLYLHYYNLAETKSGQVRRSLKHRDKAKAIENARAKVEEFQAEKARRGDTVNAQ